MKIHLHTLCWNDRAMLDYFFRHYDSWVDKYFIYDDNSNDGTYEYLLSHPKVVCKRLSRKHADSWVMSAKYIYDNSWKRSVGAADWIVVTNIDELLYHKKMADYLRKCRENGVTVIPSLGYQMVSRQFPDKNAVLCRDCREGAPWAKMSKAQIFDPRYVRETNFTPGRHQSDFEGFIRLPDRDEVLNLHYKFLGLAYIENRCAELKTGLRKFDHENKYGHRYSFNAKEIAADFDFFFHRRVDVFAVAYEPSEMHPSERWWRGKYPESRA